MTASRDIPTVLVTGASSGIGQATARLFARCGFRVFGTSRRQQPDGEGVQMLRLDVRSGESVDQCVQEALARAGRIDVLVNNAGVLHQGFVEETTIDEATGLFGTNLFGVMRMVDAVLPAMRERRQGRIVNVGSLAAWVGEPGEGLYAASKAALARYTESLRHEVWPLGIGVSLVEPGAFVTDVVDAASVSEGTISDYARLRPPVYRRLRESLRRGGDPQQVAATIVKIANARSPRRRYGVGRDGRWVPYLTVLLPQRLFDTLVRRSFALTRGRQE